MKIETSQLDKSDRLRLRGVALRTTAHVWSLAHFDGSLQQSPMSSEIQVDDSAMSLGPLAPSLRPFASVTEKGMGPRSDGTNVLTCDYDGDGGHPQELWLWDCLVCGGGGGGGWRAGAGRAERRQTKPRPLPSNPEKNR